MREDLVSIVGIFHGILFIKIGTKSLGYIARAALKEKLATQHLLRRKELLLQKFCFSDFQYHLNSKRNDILLNNDLFQRN